MRPETLRLLAHVSDRMEHWADCRAAAAEAAAAHAAVAGTCSRGSVGGSTTPGAVGAAGNGTRGEASGRGGEATDAAPASAAALGDDSSSAGVAGGGGRAAGGGGSSSGSGGVVRASSYSTLEGLAPPIVSHTGRLAMSVRGYSEDSPWAVAWAEPGGRQLLAAMESVPEPGLAGAAAHVRSLALEVVPGTLL